MEDKFIQSLKKENNFYKNLAKFSERTLPKKMEEMEKDELISYIKNNLSIKGQLKNFIQAVYLATQQSFFDEYEKGFDCNFQILEGIVNYDPSTEIFIFLPNESVKKLLESAENKNTTKLKEVLGSRFYKMVESLYKLLEIQNEK